MPDFGLLRTLARERFSREHAARQPEPELVMDDAEKVADYVAAGRELGIMAPTYIFHTAQMSEVVRPGDIVLDLACGPATQLGMLARLNPESHFIGIDLSEEMLRRARAYIEGLALDNVELRLGDITALEAVADASVDAVVSSMSLHHLPSLDSLDCCLAEIRRVLRPGGGLYLADFGHLKSEKSIRYFAYQHADRQPELFTIDYLNSLRAAFFFDDFKRLCAKRFGGDAQVLSTFAFPFMVVIKSKPRRSSAPDVSNGLAEIRASLAAVQQRDLEDLISFFRMGGLAAPLLGRR
jgi:SAM-dependent methyltransferase